MLSRTRIRSIIKFATAISITLFALTAGGRFETPARASGNGPTLTLSGPGTLPLGGAFDLVFTSNGAVADPYTGYNLTFTYDPTLVSFPSVTDNSAASLWGPDFCPLAQSNVDLGPTLTPPPLKAYIYGCFSLGGDTSSVGALATVHAQALANGTETIHMVTLGPPDNSLPNSTYTFDDSNDPQSNILACSGSCSGADVIVGNGATPTGSVSGKVYHDIATPANSLAGVVVNVCPTAGGACGSAYTDNTGAYTARFTADGTYNVTALPSNPFLTATIGPVTVSGGVNIPGNDIVMLTPPGAIFGHVYLTVAGAGNQLTGASVGVCPTAGGDCSGATTDGAGAYDITALVDGMYNVTAVAPGIDFQQTIGPVTVAGGVVSGQDIVVVIPTGAISGHVYHDSASPANALAGSRVSACPTSGSANCRYAPTDGLGAYSVDALSNGTWTVTVYPSGNYFPATLPSVAVASGGTTSGQDIVVSSVSNIPAGTSIIPSAHDGPASINWNYTALLTQTGCTGGTAGYVAVVRAQTIASGPMTEGPSGTYTGTLPAFQPSFPGAATVTITINCPGGGGITTVAFTMYIDPSGTVITPSSAPVQGASVTLLRSDSPFGPFTVVPNGSAIMSPMNRVNPVITDATGQYGWDVTAGYYRVRASKPGCVSNADPSVQVLSWRAFAQSGVLKIGPAVTGLNLVLNCDDTDQDGYTNKVEIVRGDHPTIYCKMMRADVDEDGMVSILDLSKAAQLFGHTLSAATARYDQGPPPFDGSLNILDLSKMASVFGKSVNACA
jgi:hypothetical protein